MNVLDELYVAIIGLIISSITLIVAALQISSSVKWNRYNKTFETMEKLDKMLNKNEDLLSIINAIGLMDDYSCTLSIEESVNIYNQEKNKRKIYEILNFYESLSLGVFFRHIDEKILKKIYGPRIFNAYKKLYPFITIISTKYNNPQVKPYQHFQKLYKRWRKDYE